MPTTKAMHPGKLVKIKDIKYKIFSDINQKNLNGSC